MFWQNTASTIDVISYIHISKSKKNQQKASVAYNKIKLSVVKR